MKVKTLSVADGKRLGISQFPNFHKSGSVQGMKDYFYGQNAMLIRCGSYIYCVNSPHSSNYGDFLYYDRAH